MTAVKTPSDSGIKSSQDVVTTGKAGRPKSAEKREKILSSASDVFLKNGFSATSMDMVASQAGVSKQTVYSHFSNKDTLFSAVIDHKCKEYQFDPEPLFEAELTPREVLVKYGHMLVSLLRDPEVIAMYRVVMGEVGSTPHVAELFYNAGPKAGFDLLAGFFIKCPIMQAEETLAHNMAVAFFNLLKGEHHMQALFGLESPLSCEDKDALVEFAVDQVLGIADRRQV